LPRDPRIDVLRGVALLVIASDHIPGNALAAWTLRAWGACDLAEVFVFTSGYVSGMAYGRSLRSQGLLCCQRKAMTRVLQIFLAGAVTQWVIAALSLAIRSGAPRSPLRLEMLWHAFTEPMRGELAPSLLLARALDGNLAILALYGCLLLALPTWLLLRKHYPATMLAGIFLAYGAAQFFPREAAPGWAYNPLAWQFLFFGGAVISETPQRWGKIALPGLWVGLALLVVEGVFLLKFANPAAVVPLTFKPTLGLMRVMHFAALGILFLQFAPSTEMCGIRGLAPLRVCGRNSLVTFCVGAVGAGIWSPYLASDANWSRHALANLSVWGACLASALVAQGVKAFARGKPVGETKRPELGS
jgi:hypothetical protein